jgi:hypothetical protein
VNEVLQIAKVHMKLRNYVSFSNPIFLIPTESAIEQYLKGREVGRVLDLGREVSFRVCASVRRNDASAQSPSDVGFALPKEIDFCFRYFVQIFSSFFLPLFCDALKDAVGPHFCISLCNIVNISDFFETELLKKAQFD